MNRIVNAIKTPIQTRTISIMSELEQPEDNLKGKYEYREVPIFKAPDDPASKGTFDLMTLLLGCLLYRLGGQQVFTIKEMDDMREDIGRVRVVLDAEDRIVLRIKSE